MSSGHSISLNSDGIAAIVADNDLVKVRMVGLYENAGTVQLNVRTADHDLLVYLSAAETMKLSKHLRNLAIKALENE